MQSIFHTMEHMFDRVWSRKVPFFIVFFFVALISYAILYAADFIPEPIEEDASEEIEYPDTMVSSDEDDVITENQTSDAPAIVSADDVVSESVDALPSRIVIDELDIDVLVLNPESLDLNDLDNALLDGVVRHPSSASFDDIGNILIFGHSSYLPNVRNKNFQAFNGVQGLTFGDVVDVYSADMKYTYRVNRVTQVKASETVIDNSRGKATLTIVTCNSFGSKDDRYVLEATLVSSEEV